MSPSPGRLERHGAIGGPIRPPSLIRLLVTLGLVIYAIWYLSRFAS